MNLAALQSLVHLSRAGSFVSAAQQLNMTLSTLSMQMKGLEELLGVALFDRSFRPPRLTPVGHEAVARAELVLQAQARLMEISENKEQLSGVFRLGFVATASVRMLPSFLKVAKQRAGLARFEIETALSDMLEARVINGGLDAAVVTSVTNITTELETLVIREENLKFAAPTDWRHLPLEAIARDLPFLQFNPRSGIGQVIERRIAELTAGTRRNTIVLDNVEAIVECINEGIGFTLLPEPDILRYANQDVLLEHASIKGAKRQLVLVWRRNALNSAALRSLAKFFQ